jgi:2-dehydropantoate 2-reductase
MTQPARDESLPSDATVYILGTGAIGLPLAAYLTHAGRSAVAVRTSQSGVPRSQISVSVQNDSSRITADLETVSLSELGRFDGIVVVTAKAHANRAIALELQRKAPTSPVVLLQNGVGVERAFLEAGFENVYRCVLYVTSQATASPLEFNTRPITASPIGAVNGSAAGLEACVRSLHTDHLPFRSEADIKREVWKKAIINAAFNSICPLLEVDNGVFARDDAALGLAREVVAECVTLTRRLGLTLEIEEIMAQLTRISQGSDGQFISTLQDIRAGRPTEIEFLNLEMARIGASFEPPLELPKVELLGRLTLMKSLQHVQKR